MIIINVLPPEYRRRDIGVNPITLTIAGAALVNVIILLLWAYIQFMSIPQAIDERVVATEDRRLAKAAADKVKKVDDDINKANKRFKELEDLLSKKVYWAKTLNDFVSILSNADSLNTDDFQVSIDSLEIREMKSKARATRGKKKKSVAQGRTFDFDWTARIVALDPEKLGEHTNTLFSVFETSDFWRAEESTFMDQPDTRYGGISIELNGNIGRAVTKFDLQWKRFIPPRTAKTTTQTTVKKKGASDKLASQTPKEGVK